MFSILIYLSLPFVFLFHAIEEIAKRQRWARIVADMLQQFPWQDNMLYAVSGTIAVTVNTIVMHTIFRR